MDLDDDAWDLLHHLRLRGLVEGLDGPLSEHLEAAGLVLRRRNFLALSPEGRELNAGWARCPAGSETEAAARRAYDLFGPLNTELIRLCSHWQVRPGGVPNDHSDPRYDWNVIDRLRGLDERAAPLVRRLGNTVTRFGGYRPGLRAALQRLDEGEHEWFTSPRLDSYHTVWMRLHEDLLLALGIAREDEAAAAAEATANAESAANGTNEAS